MESQSKSDPSPFQKMASLASRVMSVPKAEIDRRAEAAKKQRAQKRETRR